MNGSNRLFGQCIGITEANLQQQAMMSATTTISDWIRAPVTL